MGEGIVRVGGMGREGCRSESGWKGEGSEEVGSGWGREEV